MAAAVTLYRSTALPALPMKRRLIEKNERGKNAGQALRPLEKCGEGVLRVAPGSMDDNENVELLGLRS